jgi:hypothetical protein
MVATVVARLPSTAAIVQRKLAAVNAREHFVVQDGAARRLT